MNCIIHVYVQVAVIAQLGTPSQLFVFCQEYIPQFETLTHITIVDQSLNLHFD